LKACELGLRFGYCSEDMMTALVGGDVRRNKQVESCNWVGSWCRAQV
jgi:hypothetical protein